MVTLLFSILAEKNLEQRERTTKANEHEQRRWPTERLKNEMKRGDGCWSIVEKELYNTYHMKRGGIQNNI